METSTSDACKMVEVHARVMVVRARVWVWVAGAPRRLAAGAVPLPLAARRGRCQSPGESNPWLQHGCRRVHTPAVGAGAPCVTRSTLPVYLGGFWKGSRGVLPWADSGARPKHTLYFGRGGENVGYVPP